MGLVSDFRKRTAGKSNDEINKYLYSRGELNSRYDDAERRETPKLVEAANKYIQTVNNSAANNQGFTAAILAAKRVNEGNKLQQQLKDANMQHAASVVGTAKDMTAMPLSNRLRGSYTNGFTDAIYTNERIKQLQADASKQAAESVGAEYKVNPQGRIDQASQMVGRLKNDYRYKLAQTMFMTDRPSEQVLREFGSVENAMNYIEQMDERIKAAEQEQSYANYYGGNELKYGNLKNAEGYDSAIRLSVNSTPTMDKVLPKDALTRGVTSDNTDLFALFINGDEQIKNTIEKGYGLGARVTFLRYLTDEQKNNYNYIRATEGGKAAEQYITDIEPTLRRQQYAAEKAQAEAFAKADPVGASIQSALLSPIAGLDYFMQTADQAFGTGQDALGDARTATWMAGQQKRSLRNTVSEGIQNPWGQFFYGTGMSMADNLVNRLASGGNSGLALLLMGSGAASQTYYDALESGRSEEEALTQAAAAGIIEGVTEKIGFDNLTDIMKAGKTSFKSAATQIAKQAITEGLEEGTSNIANLAYDMIAYGGDSDAARRVKEYVKDGDSEEEARRKVAGELAAEFGTDVAGGALSGLGFGVGGTFAGTVANADAVYTDNRSAQSRLVNAARLAGVKGADRYAEKIRQGGTLTKGEFANVYDAVDVAEQKQEEKREKGYTNDKEAQLALVEEGKDLGSKHAAEYGKIIESGKALTKKQYAQLAQENADIINTQEKAEEPSGPIIIAEKATPEQLKTLNEMASTFADSKSTFIKGYEPNVNGKPVSVKEYTAAVNSVVKAFASGDKVNPIAYDTLGREGFKAARTIAIRQHVGTTMQQAEDAAAKMQERLDKLRTGSTAEIRPGKVTYTNEAAQNRVGAANAALFIAHSKAYGTNFEIHDTLEKENGYYDPKSNTIHLAADAEDPLAMVAAHELTHYIEKWSPEKYQGLVKLLKNYYGGEWNGLVDAKMQSYGAAGISLSINGAVDEVVADACQLFFGMDASSDEYAGLIEEIAKNDKTLARKIVDFLEEIYEAIKELLISLNPRSAEAQILSENKKMLEKARVLWNEALESASVTSAAVNAREQEVLAANGISYDEDTQSVHSIRHSFATKDDIKGVNIDGLAEIIAKATDRSPEDAKKWIQSEMTVANAVLADPEFLDFEVDNRYEAIKKNSDYPQGTVDLSNLCPKRTEFTTMFDMIQKKYPNKMFTAQDVAEMRNILKDHDITVACGCCYVEDRRQLLGEIADTYIGMWKEAVETGKPLRKVNSKGDKVQLNVTVKLAKQYGITKGTPIMATDSYIPTQYDLTTYEGFKTLEKEHPTVALGFVRYNNSRGQQAARLIEGRAEYDRQILGWSPAKVKSVNNNGGLRIFSFSDFEVVHLLDLVQVIIDCSAKGVKIQGYTKIPAFARLVRNTGIKLNRSLIPKGATGLKYENGKWVLEYDATEGIDINDENFLDERDNPNVGNIIIGINRQQIGVAMLDDFIDYIIPFHSNKSKDILQKSGVGEWENYKESQHEKDIETGKAAKKNVNIYTQVINKYKPKNKVEFVNAFLKECKAQGKIPRYSEFLNRDENGDFTYREGYHKLLIDFKMFDAQGNILPQGNIVPELDNDFMTEMLEAEVDRKKTYEFPDAVYNEIEEAFGGEIQRSIRDSEYLKAVEDNDMETAQRLVDEAAREAGFAEKGFHGTGSSFNIFSEGKIGGRNVWGKGFYFGKSRGIADDYALWRQSKGGNYRIVSAFLKMQNPFVPYKSSLGSAKEILDKWFPDMWRTSRELGVGYIENKLNNSPLDLLQFIAEHNKIEVRDVLRQYGFDSVKDGGEYVVFASNQIKSADPVTYDDNGNVIPLSERFTDSEDIRYSVRRSATESGMQKESEQTGKKSALVRDEEIKTLIKENEVFKKRIAKQDDIIKELKRQMKPTDALRNDRAEINKYARELKKTYGTDVDAKYIADTLDEMYTEMMRAQPDEAYIRELGVGLAKEMLENSMVIDTKHEETYKHVRDTLKSFTFSLTDEQKAEAKIISGSYGKFRQEMFGSLNIRNDASSLDSNWEQIHKDLEGRVDLQATEGNQVVALYELAKKAQKQYKTAYEDMRLTLDEAAVELFTDFRAKQIELSLAKGTFADEMLKRIEKANERTEEVRRKEREKFAEYREKKAKEPVLKSIADKAKGLRTLLEKPNERSGQYVPDALKSSLLKALVSIDESSKKNKSWAKGLSVLADRLQSENSEIAPMINPYIVPAFAEMTERLINANEGKTLEDLKLEDLKTVRDTLASIRHAINAVNQLYKNERYATAVAAAEATMLYARTRRHKFHDWKGLNSIKGFFNVGQMDAYTYFSMFGESGQSIADELSKGQDKAHDRIREAAAWVQNMRGRLRLTHKDMNEWKKEKHTFKLESGDSVTMTTREVMEFYLLTNRPQARQHILEGGFSVASATQKRTYTDITENDIDQITKVLSGKQKKAADAMQRYLSTTVAGWGNEVSRRAYGVRLFTEPNYWRIRTGGSSRDVEDQAQQIRSEALKYARQNAAINAGFTKHTNEFANNPLIVSDVFDTFDEHISGMATYNGLALAIDDANKWLMYARRDENNKKKPNEDVKTAIRSVLGEVGVRYAENLLMDLNGLTPRVDESVLSKLMSNYKKSSVAAKIRVIIQQPTAMLRATAEINPAYMALATAKQVQPGLIKEMQKYSSIAWWKSNGNYDIGTGKSIHEILFGSDTAMRKISSAALLPAGKADDIAWAVIWQACKEEYAHNSKIKIKNFSAVDFAKVAERFSEVVNKTQVVDTILHRSQNMRTKTVAMSQLTAFMSEPTKIFNMIRRSVVELANADKKTQAKAAKRLLRTLLAWSASAVANAAVKSLWDAFRKREKDKEYSEQYQETFITNVLDEINVIRLIPIANNLWSIAEGYDQTSMPFDFAEKLRNGINQLTKFDDENRSFTMYSAASNLANFFSAAFGLPLAGLVSNFEGIWQGITGENIKHKKSKTENYADMQEALESGKQNKYDKAYEAVYAQVAQDVAEKRAESPEEYEGLTDEEVIQQKISAGVKAAAKKKYYDKAIDAFEGGIDEYNRMVKDLEKYGITADDVKGWVRTEFKDEYVTGRDEDLKAKLINAGVNEDDLFDWVTSSYKEEALEKIESGDENALAEYAENLASEGIEPQNIWSRCRSIFKDEYQEAWRNGDKDRTSEIETMLESLGLKNKKGQAYADSDFFEGWREAAESGE